MRTTFDLHRPGVLDHLRLSSGCSFCGQDAIGVAVQNERRYGVARDVQAEILNPRIDATQRASRRRADGHIPVFLEDALAHELASRDVVVVEVAQKFHQEGRSIRLDRSLDAVEDAPIYSLRVAGRFHEIRTECSHEHGLAHPYRAVLDDIPLDLARTHREAD